MDTLKINMINEALERYRKIFPCSDRVEFSDCFTINCNQLLFWFNTEDKTTHILAAPIPRAVVDY